MRFGALGEEAAADLLRSGGYRIVARNHRCPRGEIDLIDSRASLDRHWATWERGDRSRVGLIVAMEGADPIISPAQSQRWL